MRPGAPLDVVGRALVRVLAVRKLARAVEGRRKRLRELDTALKPAQDRRGVRGRSRERGRSEATPKLVRNRTASRPQLLEHTVVVLRPAYGNDRGEVLGGGPQERRAADVDHLDHAALVQLGPLDGELERIQVHTDQIERLDTVLGERGEVLFELAAAEDPRVDAGMQGLHAPAEYLWKTRPVLAPRPWKSRLF